MSDAQQFPIYGPRTLGQILDRVYRLLRANLKLLVGISAAPPTVLFLSLALAFCTIMLPLLSQMPKNMNPAQQSQILIAFVAFGLVVFVLYMAVFGLSLAAASEAAVRADLGSHTTFPDAYRHACQKYARYVLLLVLMFLISMGPLIVIELIAAGATLVIGHELSSSSPAFFVLIPAGFLLLLMCLIFSILASLRLSLAFPACVTENLTAMEAIRRSNRLAHGAMGRIFVVLLVIHAIAYAAYLLVIFVTMLGSGLVALIGSGLQSHLPPAIGVPIIVCAAIIVSGVMVLYMACTLAGFTTGLAVIYNDQRVRIDGVPIEHAPFVP